MICVPITDQTHAKALRSIERSAPMVDALELRMDLIEDGDLPNLLARARQVAEGIKVIVTCRRPEEALVPVDQSKSKPKTVRSKAVKMKRL